MLNGFKSIFEKHPNFTTSSIDKHKFTIIHSQCRVTYDINGFKLKNMDKVSPEITDVYSRLFVNPNKEQTGRTLLFKFAK